MSRGASDGPGADGTPVHDVVVVGAGVAGLTAALRLQQRGLDVLVLEARTRAGGRASSVALGSGMYDVGATWVWQGEDAVLSMLQELGLETFIEEDAGDDVWDGGVELQRGRFPRSAAVEYRVRGGVGAFARELAQRVQNVQLDTRVRAIESTSTGLLVSTESRGAFRAQHVVAAVPPSLLGATIEVELEGAMRDFLRTVPVWMGDIAKVVAVYPRAFWRDAGLSGRAASRTGPMVEVRELCGPPGTVEGALFGFVPWPLATEGWRARLPAQLARLFGPGAAEPLALHVQVWWDERETSPAAGSQERLHLLGAPRLREPLLGGRLHLASTEAAPQSPGHLDGAIRRGEQVAELIGSSWGSR